MKELNRELLDGEFGISIGKRVYKKRVKNIDLHKGKSGGFRLIGYKDNEMGKFYLLTIYSKSNKDAIQEKEIIELLKNIGVFY